MQVVELDGNQIEDMNSFYDEVQLKLTKDFPGFGRNLNAFNDVLRGGFNVFEYEEPITLVWNNSARSKQLLADDEGPLFNHIVEIIQEHPHITLELR